MKASLAAVTVVVALIASLAAPAWARPSRDYRTTRATRATPSSRRAAELRKDHRVAIQPFEGGTSAAPLRSLVTRIVRGHGFRPVTSIPRYEGTGQYPSLAREHHLTAFVTAGLEERGKWSSVTFLVWSGTTGSVVRRWTASAPTAELSDTVGKGFWSHLGGAVQRTAAPPLPPDMDQAPLMRIDASEPRLDEPVAVR